MSDAELTAAFQEEVIADEVIDPIEAADEIVEEEVKLEEVEDLLPTDHKERSDLGRKVAALLKKTDKTDDVLLQLSKVIERLAPRQEYNEEDDLPVTRKELRSMVEQPGIEAGQYETDFKSTFWKLTEIDGLSEEEAEAIAQITIEKYNIPFTKDPKIDGAMNYSRAKEDYFVALKKKLPLKGGKAPGVVSKQASDTRAIAKPKLDQAAESFYNFIARTDGEDAAKKRLKAL